MVYNVLIKGFSVGMTRIYSEAQQWLSGAPAALDTRIVCIPDEVKDFRNYKC